MSHLKLSNKLELDQCPHCSIARPNLESNGGFPTQNHYKQDQRFWSVYVCNSCGGAVIAFAQVQGGRVVDVFPKKKSINEDIPERAKNYLKQAMNSLHAPAGAVMLAASAVDAMLKEKGYRDGNLYPRINAAEKDHILTQDMVAWAHEVRLEANDQRHADDEAPIPDQDHAQRVLDFALALAEYLFVLPAKVRRGRQNK